MNYEILLNLIWSAGKGAYALFNIGERFSKNTSSATSLNNHHLPSTSLKKYFLHTLKQIIIEKKSYFLTVGLQNVYFTHRYQIKYNFYFIIIYFF